MSRNDPRACPQSGRQKSMPKSDKAEMDERYLALRRRNNIAVRKSRQKLREKQNEVVNKLSMLQLEYANLQNMVSSRLREVKLLYSLLQQVGHTPPKHMDELLASAPSSSCSLPPSKETLLSSCDAPLSSPQHPGEGSSPSPSQASTASITAASSSMLDLIVLEESPDPTGGTIPPPAD